MAKNIHSYTLDLTWLGDPALKSISNDRVYEVKIKGKEPFVGSADSAFHGDASKYNPEDLLLAALTSCHMMSFLYLCKKNDINVLTYRDNPKGELKVNLDGSGQFQSVVLRPEIETDIAIEQDRLLKLHEEAGKLCFIANSLNFPIRYLPTIKGQMI